jgi:hypothetical protein
MESEMEVKDEMTKIQQTGTDVLQLELSKLGIRDQEDLQAHKIFAKKFEEIRKDLTHWQHIETMGI